MKKYKDLAFEFYKLALEKIMKDTDINVNDLI